MILPVVLLMSKGECFLMWIEKTQKGRPVVVGEDFAFGSENCSSRYVFLRSK
jgi:FAD synthase